MAVLIAFVGGTLLFLFLLWLSARRAITVCMLEVHGGEMVVTQGNIAPRVLSDLRDVVKRPSVSHASVRIVRAREQAIVEASGDLSGDQLQQLRNIVGNVPLAKLAPGASRKKKGSR